MRRRMLNFLAVAGALWHQSTTGQTLFAWPDTAVNLRNYTTIEQCHGAAQRVYWAHWGHASGWARVTGVLHDTVAHPPFWEFEPLPRYVEESIGGCLAGLPSVDSTPSYPFDKMLTLYLLAGQLQEANALVERRIDAIVPTAEGELAAVLDTVYVVSMGYALVGGLHVLPRRPGFAKQVLEKYVDRVPDRVARWRVLMNLLALPADDGALDTVALQIAVARRLGPLRDSLTQEERQRLAGEVASLYGDDKHLEERFAAMMDLVYGRDYLDSLRVSTSAYVRFRRATWSQALDQPPETFGWGMPIGERAPALSADVWLGCGDECGRRPAPGRVSLVLFFTHGSCLGPVPGPARMNGVACAKWLVPLRRLARRFPALDITVATITYGYFAYLKEEMTVSKEAELFYRLLESYGLQPVLAVEETAFWKLPDPDGRRFATAPPPNWRNYSFGRSWPATHAKAYLIDQDGIIVYSNTMSTGYEADFAALIEVLLERSRSSAS